MKKLILFCIFLLFTVNSFSQYRILYFVDVVKGKKSTTKKLLLNEIKKSNQIRINNGLLKGYDVWETIPGGGNGLIDFIIVDLHDNLENYHKSRSIPKNLNFNKEQSSKFWNDWNTSTTGDGYRVIVKSEAFASKSDKLPKIAKFNMFRTLNSKMRTKWINYHKKFASNHIKGKRDAWGSASVIFKPSNVKFNHITVDFFDNENIASFLLDDEKWGMGWTDETIDYWMKEDGTRTMFNNEVRVFESSLFTKKILELR
jgi:hypothetical protein